MTLTTSNVTSGFIDLATFDEIEKYLYGGSDATAYFVRETRKSTWFTQVPVALSRSSGEAKFGQQCSWSVSRAGDYLLHSWLRATLPALVDSGTEIDASGHLEGVQRWCRNVGHNLIEECAITFNDLVAARFDNYHLDFWTAFTVPASKRVGYNNMIGNVDALNNPATLLVDCSSAKISKPEKYTINVPLPLFYTRDSGVALPTAALPYNDMRITIKMRKLNELVVEGDASGTWTATPTLSSTGDLTDVDLWCNYAIVSNDERKRMACAPRDILIEQVQTAPTQQFKLTGTTRMDIRFSHAIKVLFFAVRNKIVQNEWSNYESHQLKNQNVDLSGNTEGVVIGDGVVISHENSIDPIAKVSLVYENTNRLSSMGSDYFSLVNPYYHAPSIPEVTGYHCYSYSLDFASLDPMGSTNYGKLTNVSLIAESCNKLEGKNATDYDMVVTAVNNNIIRVSGGALGFPVL